MSSLLDGLTLEAMHYDFEEEAHQYHRKLPGLLRALLVDHGIASDIIDQNLLGWNGEKVTIPVRGRDRKIVSFERWEPERLGVPLVVPARVELFGWDIVKRRPGRLIYCEGVLEALIARSQGLSAIAATGTGRFFKSRHWAAALRESPDVVVALKKGEKRDSGKGLPSRGEVQAKILSDLPRARLLQWRDSLSRNEGFYEFFVRDNHTREKFDRLCSRQWSL